MFLIKFKQNTPSTVFPSLYSVIPTEVLYDIFSGKVCKSSCGLSQEFPSKISIGVSSGVLEGNPGVFFYT